MANKLHDLFTQKKRWALAVSIWVGHGGGTELLSEQVMCPGLLCLRAEVKQTFGVTSDVSSESSSSLCLSQKGRASSIRPFNTDFGPNIML